jgi:hypothetical protein
MNKIRDGETTSPPLILVRNADAYPEPIAPSHKMKMIAMMIAHAVAICGNSAIILLAPPPNGSIIRFFHNVLLYYIEISALNVL